MTTAVVAVAAGDGIKRIFYSLGVQGIVAGGQSMNPSTADLLAAVEAVPAEQVVILPNNKNIIPVAEQVDAHSDKVVRVVPHPGHRRGLRRPHGLRPRGAGRRERQGDGLAVGQRGGRRGDPGGARLDHARPAPIAEGDYLGIARDGIKAVAGSAAEAACGLLDVLVTEDHEIVTIIEGEGATAADTRQITEWLDEHRPDVSAEVHHGGQPLYPYLLRHRVATAAVTDGPITLGELSAVAGDPAVAGVGDRKAEALAVVGVETLADLLTYYPRRYVDRTNECQSATWRWGRRRWSW